MNAPIFFADAMLGGLVRWLRVADFDTCYEPALDDHSLVANARHQSRALLTRDRHLVTFLRPEPALLIRADRPLDQLREVVTAFGLGPPAALFQRCLVCNSPLRAASAEEAASAPASARRFPEPLRACPGCGRVYWLGSHTRRMRATLAEAVPEWFG